MHGSSHIISCGPDLAKLKITIGHTNQVLCSMQFTLHWQAVHSLTVGIKN